jgi:hypothetical protein
MKRILRRIRDGLRDWLVAGINDGLCLNRRILTEVLANLLEVKRTMVTTAQVNSFVEELNQKLTKLGDDIVAHIGDLRDQISKGQDLSPTLAKLERLGTKLQELDVIPERPTAAPVAEAPAPALAPADSTGGAAAESGGDQAAAAKETQPLTGEGSSESSGS